MSSGTAAYFPRVPRWHELYKAALFETDRDKIPQRIAEAEKSIVARARELFATNTDNIEEGVAKLPGAAGVGCLS